MADEAPGISGPLVEDDTVLYRLHSVSGLHCTVLVAQEMRSANVRVKWLLVIGSTPVFHIVKVLLLPAVYTTSGHFWGYAWNERCEVNGYFGLELFRNVSCVTVHIHIRYHSENAVFRLVVQVLLYSALFRDVFGQLPTFRDSMICIL